MSRRKRFTRNLGRTLPAPKALRTTRCWLRFEHQDEPYGVFSYRREARQRLSEGERAEMDDLMVWICERLDAPEEDWLDQERFWFRAEASDVISKVRRLVELVCEAGFPIIERRSNRVPGKVRWQDRDQVAVLTYRDTPQPKKRRC
jgi:hypothetical protein